MCVEADFIKEALDAGLYNLAVTMRGYLSNTVPVPVSRMAEV